MNERATIYMGYMDTRSRCPTLPLLFAVRYSLGHGTQQVARANARAVASNLQSGIDRLHSMLQKQ